MPGHRFGRWEGLAEKILADKDDLSLVARLGRKTAQRLERQGNITSLTELAEASTERLSEVARTTGLDLSALLRLQRQAALQVRSRHHQRSEQPPEWDLLEGGASARLLQRFLPPESPGDVYFDLEGHPFASTPNYPGIGSGGSGGRN